MPRPAPLLAPLLALAVALPLAAVDGPPDEPQESRERLAALRKDPLHKDRLRRLEQETRTFLALPPAEQERLRKLDRDLHRQPSATQAHLYEVMRRYADWLERLSAAERRAVVDAPGKKARLEQIRALREAQWVARQPEAVRNRLEAARHAPAVRQGVAAARAALFGSPVGGAVATAAAPLLLPGTDLRARLVAKQRQDERERRHEWQLAVRYWEKLQGKQWMPTRLSDFGLEVETFVKEYLRPMLSREERERLDKAEAEGRWPLFPHTLVELADRHPVALPGAHGPTSFKELPQEVQRRLKSKAVKSGDGIPPKIKKAEGRFLPFAGAVTEFVAKRPGLQLPHELWPSRLRDLSPRMQDFVNKVLMKKLDQEEAKVLKAAEGKWPEYPQAIQELATRHYLTVPWHTLPDPPKWLEPWDKYRLKPRAGLEGFPELPRQKLLNFARVALPPGERAALRLGEGDPEGWRRLTEEYFKRHPAAREQTRQQDFRQRPFGDAFLSAPRPPVPRGL
jgi:hypothetical protein